MSHSNKRIVLLINFYVNQIPSKKEMNTICSYTKQHPGSILDAPEQYVMHIF